MKNLRRSIVGLLFSLVAVAALGAARATAQCGHGGMMGGGSHAGHEKSEAPAEQKDAAVHPVVVDGVQIVKIVVNGSGYTPSRIAVRKDMPVRIVFEQWSSSACVAQVQSPALKIAKTKLPLGKETAIEFMPSRAGTYEFTCGMEMITGTIDVE